MDSSHFNGKKFLNSPNFKDHGLFQALKMIVSLRFQKWPKYVVNKTALNFNLTLAPNEVSVTFVNHATMLVQTSEFTFLTDPVWSKRVSPFKWIGPQRHRDPGVRLDQLPKINFILISHNHYDHMDLKTLELINQRDAPLMIVPLGNKVFLNAQGFKNVVELDWWKDVSVGSTKVTCAPAQHFSGRGVFDRNKTLWASFFISYGKFKIYFGGDTGYSNHFKKIFEKLGCPDLSFIPIGAYSPRWFMKAVHMNPEEAVQAHIDLQSKKSIGIHFNTFQLTEEPIDEPQKDLTKHLELRQIPATDFFTLPEGQTSVFRL